MKGYLHLHLRNQNALISLSLVVDYDRSGTLIILGAMTRPKKDLSRYLILCMYSAKGSIAQEERRGSSLNR